VEDQLSDVKTGEPLGKGIRTCRSPRAAGVPRYHPRGAGAKQVPEFSSGFREDSGSTLHSRPLSSNSGGWKDETGERALRPPASS